MESVNHPKHYNLGKIEVIEAIEDWVLDFHLGNAVKYIARAGKKNTETTLEDLKKAQWYLQRKIDSLTPKSYTVTINGSSMPSIPCGAV